MTSLQKQAVSGVKWTSVSTVIITLTEFLQLSILARLLLPEDFGLMAIVMIIVGFAQAFGDMGISNAIIYRQDATREELSSLYWLNLMAGILVFILILASKTFVADFYKEYRLKNLISWVAIIFVITPIGQQFQILLQKELDFERLAKIEIFATAAGSGVAIVAALRGQGVYALVWGVLTNTGLKSMLLASIGWRKWQPQFRFRLSDLERYMKFGLYQMGERSINYLGWQLDKLLIGYLYGAQSLGYYSVAYNLMVRPFQTINPVITRVAFPVFAKTQFDNKRLRSGFLEIISVIALLLMPIYWWMISVAEPLITLVLGYKWAPAIPLFQILAILGFFYSLGNPVGSLLMAKGRADIGFYLNVLMIVLYGCAVWIGSIFGLTGIAWALVIATAAVLFPVGLWIRWKLIELRPLEYIRSFATFFVFGCVMAVVVYALHKGIRISRPVIELVVLSVVSAVLYMGMLLKWQRPFIQKVWITIIK